MKCGAEVSVSTRNAVRGTNLGQAEDRKSSSSSSRSRSARERRRALEAKLEADLVRRLLEMEKHA